MTPEEQSLVCEQTKKLLNTLIKEKVVPAPHSSRGKRNYSSFVTTVSTLIIQIRDGKLIPKLDDNSRVQCRYCKRRGHKIKDCHLRLINKGYKRGLQRQNNNQSPENPWATVYHPSPPWSSTTPSPSPSILDVSCSSNPDLTTLFL
jgi:hypothetical protein